VVALKPPTMQNAANEVTWINLLLGKMKREARRVDLDGASKERVKNIDANKLQETCKLTSAFNANVWGECQRRSDNNFPDYLKVIIQNWVGEAK
jgi:hypothetical protein